MPDPDVRANTPATVIPGEAPLRATTVSVGKLLRPSAVLAETMGRNLHGGNMSVLASGRQSFQLIYLERGTTVSTIALSSWTTAAVTPTNQWFALYSLTRALLAVTADDTTTAWAAFSVKSLAVTTPYYVPEAGFYYIGCMVAAATVPTLFGATIPSAYNNAVPLLLGYDNTNTGLTTPATAPNPAAALTASASVSGTLLAYVT